MGEEFSESWTFANFTINYLKTVALGLRTVFQSASKRFRYWHVLRVSRGQANIKIYDVQKFEFLR